jgi:hypothetical protein
VFGRRDLITIRVSRRVLWIGEAAYPLHNIVFATTTVKPRTEFAVIFKRVGAVVLIPAAVAVVIALGDASDDQAGEAVVFLGVMALILAFVLSVLVKLAATARRRIHLLNIATAGWAFCVVASPDKAQLTRICEEIMAAIDDPQAEFAIQIENFHIGDDIKQFGSNNIGKATR